MKEEYKVKERTEGKPKVGMAKSMICLLIVVAVIAAAIWAGVGIAMAIFAGAIASVIIALVLKTPWKDIQKEAFDNLAGCSGVFMILLMVGMLTGIWLIGGTLPSLIYYGLRMISPAAILPLSFILCGLTSLCTGTSYGSVATMGLAMYGIGVNMGIPAVVMAGAVVSGSFFGDKMSPMSDTTNVAPAMAGTDLYSHIGSMMYTTIPATIVTFLIYLIYGLHFSVTGYDPESIVEMENTLQGNFNISVVCLVPLIMLLILSVLRVPSILAMGLTAVVSMAFAVLTQGAALTDVLSVAMNGYVSETGLASIDKILTRGGVVSMTSTVFLIFFSAFLAGAMKASGILDGLIAVFTGMAKTTFRLVAVTLVFAWTMVGVSGSQMLGLIIPGKAMGDLYDKKNISRKVLSRSLEDSATIGAAIIPWTNATAYITGVLGCGIGYIPFAFLCYLVPVFSLICAATGIGIWTTDGAPVRTLLPAHGSRIPEEEKAENVQLS